MTVAESHDIGLAVQEKLEAIEDVARAFVHVSVEVCPDPFHACLLNYDCIPW
jgi:hypothetical protein